MSIKAVEQMKWHRSRHSDQPINSYLTRQRSWMRNRDVDC